MTPDDWWLAIHLFGLVGGTAWLVCVFVIAWRDFNPKRDKDGRPLP